MGVAAILEGVNMSQQPQAARNEEASAL
jgi:hypothetical protein